MGLRSLLPDKPLRVRRRWAFATLFVIGIVALGLLLWLWGQDPDSKTLEFETAKTCLQVIGLVVLGAVVALATSSVEYSRQEKAELRHAEDAEDGGAP